MNVERAKLISRAASIFEKNDFAPASPGQFGADDKPQVCAALALAAAIVEKESGSFQSGLDYAVKILSNTSKHEARRMILDVVGLYFRDGTGSQTMIFNDEQHPMRRKTAVLRFFRRWAQHSLV